MYIIFLLFVSNSDGVLTHSNDVCFEITKSYEKGYRFGSNLNDLTKSNAIDLKNTLLLKVFKSLLLSNNLNFLFLGYRL